jgi:hypothetical protein
MPIVIPIICEERLLLPPQAVFLGPHGEALGVVVWHTVWTIIQLQVDESPIRRRGLVVMESEKVGLTVAGVIAATP